MDISLSLFHKLKEEEKKLEIELILTKEICLKVDEYNFYVLRIK